jgi:hypothetical protein
MWELEVVEEAPRVPVAVQEPQALNTSKHPTLLQQDLAVVVVAPGLDIQAELVAYMAVVEVLELLQTLVARVVSY